MKECGNCKHFQPMKKHIGAWGSCFNKPHPVNGANLDIIATDKWAEECFYYEEANENRSN